MPARCWMAPEIPFATYSCGETTLPVWPTWNACGVPAGVHRGAGRADRRAERVGEPLDLRRSRRRCRVRRTTTIAAWSSSGRPGGLAGLDADDPRALGGLGIDGVNGSTGPAASAGSGVGGVGLERDDRRPSGDPRLDGVAAGEDRLRRDRDPVAASLDVDGVGDQAGVGLDREPAGDLLALRRGGEQHRGRRGFCTSCASTSALGATRQPADCRPRRRCRPSPRRTAAAVRRPRRPGPDEDRRRLAEPAGDRQQLEGRLADRAVRRGRRGRGPQLMRVSCFGCQ